MKTILVLLSCLVLALSSVFGDDNSQLVESESNNPVTSQRPAVPSQQVPRPVAPPGGSAPPAVMNNAKPPMPANAPAPAMTPEKIKSFFSKPKEDNYIILNFDNADLKDVINTVGSITNENFILSPGLDARVTIHSAKKVPVSEVMSVFESVLEANGMSLVRSGEFLKIVSGTTAKQKPLDVRKGNQPESIPYVDRPVTQIVPVQYVPVTEISTVLNPMLSQFGSIIPNPRNNLLIINDLSSNIIRLLKVLKEIDVNAFKNTRMSFFKPKYSDVLSLSSELTEVLNALNLTREGIALVPIERINSLVVFSSSPTLLKTVEGWIRKLDEEVMTGQNIFVYPVQNVKAEKIADILKSLYESSDGSQKKVARRTTQTTQKKTAARRTTSVSRKQQTSGGSRVEIITFEPTNSLVILAPPGIYREIVKTIKKMDSYPREVLIEAVIASVRLTDSDKSGIQWSVLKSHTVEDKNFDSLAQGSTGQTGASNLPNVLPGLAQGISGGLSYTVFRPDKFIAMLDLLSTKNKVNILSSPSLLVRDQEEASIEVGNEIPTATSTTSTTTTDTLTQNIEYKTVGIKLKIKPTISEDRTVVLELEQEVSQLEGDQQVGQQGNTFPSFSTTKTKTSIVIPDRQGVIIGGIIEETKNKGFQGIPFLSEIPLLGRLFRYDVSEVNKREIIIMITPYVITGKDEASKLSSQYIEGFKGLKNILKSRESTVK